MAPVPGLGLGATPGRNADRPPRSLQQNRSAEMLGVEESQSCFAKVKTYSEEIIIYFDEYESCFYFL